MRVQRNQFQIGGAVVDFVSKAQVLALAQDFLKSADVRAAVIATVNAQFVHLASRQSRFAAFLRRADLSVADGMSLVFASRILGTPLPERIAGVDLACELCALLAAQGGSVYLFGGRPGSAAIAQSRLRQLHPALRVVGVECPPWDFEKSPELAELALRRIQAAHPDLLLVGLGAPKQEYWIEENLHALPCKLVLGVGGTFEILSGRVRRAPSFMQQWGAEWFFRLCSEPKRLGLRYLSGNTYFVWALLRCGLQQQCYRMARLIGKVTQ